MAIKIYTLLLMDLQEYVNNDKKVLERSYLVQIDHILLVNFLC